jgi:uroporphyrin-III C-methyltransferase / precorrin-2 dehydrogenase / sirohydrochlorin ferrochelatase
VDTLSLSLQVKGRRCLVVGGGAVATRKVHLLLKTHALVTVIAPNATAELMQLSEKQQIIYHSRPFQSDDLKDFFLVIAATDQSSVNSTIAQLADQQRILVNVVDAPHLGNVMFPSIVDRSPIQISVSSGGASPVLARLLRARLETFIPANYGQLADLTRKFRDRVKKTFSDHSQRRRFWEQALQSPVTELMLAGKREAAEQLLEKQLVMHQPTSGEVYLVGSGPGDPDLLTFRALRLMQQADVVVYDRLVSQPILDLVRRDAEKIYVGKERSNHVVPQEDINQLLATLAKQGKRVLRLKGGDPFMFGRGGEEIETLSADGIPFEVVPAVTAALGTAAYAGIPLTHRDYAQSCVFVTGHLKDGSMDLNWQTLVQPNQTVVVYMGLQGIEQLCEKLMQHGLSKDHPIALVQQATTQNQKVVIGTLETLPEKVRNAHIQPPSLVIVGNVVKLHEKLAWFKPLENHFKEENK